jgi:hypothetical protein
MTDRAAGFFGLAATACFTISLLVFADIYPGYSHATKAISELGAIGAPHQVGWNLLGFMLPGLLLAFHGWGVGQAGHDRIAAVLFSLAGLSFAATSIPVDMSSYHLPTSQAHITASLGVFVFPQASTAWRIDKTFTGHDDFALACGGGGSCQIFWSRFSGHWPAARLRSLFCLGFGNVSGSCLFKEIIRVLRKG